ncbi:glycoside hydrolase family 2 TIM barrel-domain containing protein [Aestuariivivens sediminis]|uniref:glycoside hydrolase family 2 TIM barrel-domain containing protein n=1 Tax=Aestuariivivens sediminis TaxID=2913557 RepID=UPI001F56420F|nr:glycoside hydrolase family 2 TIM barrel-domain containing protein [Aestuariivivens sediminis]
MKYIYSLVVITVLFSCRQEHRQFIGKVNFNKDWHFQLLTETQTDSTYFHKDLNMENWEKVGLPHTPRIEPKIVNEQWQGLCWYRKTFSLSPGYQGKQLWLTFEGAMNRAEVWVNGKKLITHQGGYLPFVVDFTDVALFNEENLIAVRLDNTDNPITGPKPLEILDFNTYGGIHRNVWLIAKDPLHITDPVLEGKRASGGVFVTYPEVSKERARVHVQTHIKNRDEKEKSFVIRNTLYRNDSTVIAVESNPHRLPAHQDTEVITEMIVDAPALWSPQYPNLYRLKTEIVTDGVMVDQEIHRIGIKTMAFKGQEFYLNGEKTFLRGVNRHQEYPYIGYALSDNAQYRDAKKIKDAGFDYVRLSHYPQAPAFMDACDELGIMTIDAILGWQYFSEDSAFQKQVFQTAKDLIRRDRNHVSVLAWEVSLNESWMPEPFIDSLTAIAHNEYPGNPCFTAGWQPYGYDIYLQARQHRLKHYDRDLKKPYNVSEYGDWEYYAMNAGLNQNSWENLLQEDRSSRQLRGAGEKRLLQQATNIQEAHNDNLGTPAFADGYWVMFDYNRGYANDLESSGIMDLFRVPKPAYYFFQSQRDATDPFGTPMVHIANNWQKDSPLDVRIFSNCEEVELFLNGKSLGRQRPDENRISHNLNHPPFTFKMKTFTEGTLEAKGYIKDRVVATFIRQTPEAPSKITIVVDDNYKNRSVESPDYFFVHAYITDAHGTTVSNYTGDVSFTVLGEAEVVGENPVACEAGISSILLRKNKGGDRITIVAKAKALGLTGVYRMTP